MKHSLCSKNENAQLLSSYLSLNKKSDQNMENGGIQVYQRDNMSI